MQLSSSYAFMMRDTVRIQAYADALKQALSPDSVVLDIGTGTGILALLACQLGARHVYAIDPHSAIKLGVEIAEANGFSDRITFIQARSQTVDLPEPADILTSEIRGIIPFFTNSLGAIQDAQERLLKPDAILIPHSDTIYVSGWSMPGWYEQHITQNWQPHHYGIDFSPQRRYLVNDVVQLKRRLPGKMILDPLVWYKVYYHNIESGQAESTVNWRASHPSSLHAFVLWFDAHLGSGIQYTSLWGTQRSTKIYGQAVLPLAHPISLATGDEVTLNLKIRLFQSDYIWEWKTNVVDEAGAVKHQLQQSNLVVSLLKD